MQDKQIALSLSIPALQLIMEGLSQLPLYRSKQLFDALEAEAKRQLEPKVEEAPEEPKE